MNKIYLEIENCIDCPNHEVSPDPNPYDWFCDDDIKVRCIKSNNQIGKRTRNDNLKIGEPYITVACRPHNKRNECKIPDWCPLKNNASD